MALRSPIVVAVRVPPEQLNPVPPEHPKSVQISGTTGGDGHDTGSSSLPTSGGDLVGRVQSASTGGGGFSIVNVFPPEISAVNPSGAGITGPGTTIVGDLVIWNSITGAVVADAGAGTAVVNGVLHSGNTFYGGSYSTTSVSPSTVIGNSPTIPAGSKVSFHCSGIWSSTWSTGINGHIEMQINASQTPVDIWYTLTSWSASGVSHGNISTTNATLIDGGSETTSGVNNPWSLDGEINWNAGSPGTFALQAATNVTSATLAVVTNSWCAINP